MFILKQSSLLPDQDTRTPGQELPRTAHLDSAHIGAFLTNIEAAGLIIATVLLCCSLCLRAFRSLCLNSALSRKKSHVQTAK